MLTNMRLAPYLGVLASLMLVTVAELDLSDMPRSICGWPAVYDGGRFPPYNTRAAQRLLGLALNLPEQEIIVDGVLSDVNTQQIIDFETAEGLKADGHLNANSWPVLVDKFSSLSVGASGMAVEAVQDLLNVNGIATSITGVFDEVTASSLATFQQSHGAEVADGQTVDAQTWYLLITQCNNSATNYYWFDAGWPQGAISVDTFKCLRESGFVFTTIECWREKDNGTFVADCVSNVANAWAAGFENVDVYMYAERFYDPVLQMNSFIDQLTKNNVKFGNVMIDIEGSDWYSFTFEQNQEYLLTIKNMLEAANLTITIYAGAAWDSYFGTDFTAFSDYPLIYAHYDNVPSFYDYDYAPFGGWSQASAKQFYDGIEPEVVCNLSLDWDWSPTKFWVK
jgi:peptidoglycan hydrolase-like protein with peptidoglycan-binding domain